MSGMVKPDTRDTIRENLVRFRKEASLSQAAAAEAAGISIDNLRRYESGKTDKVPSDVLAALAPVYGHAQEDFSNPSPPKAKLADRPVFFLRTRPGVEIDEKVYADLLKVIDDANRTATGKRKR
jgi:transcriptional regulator with XRE-family HTH domain